MSNDRSSEIENLKILVDSGNRLNKDVKKFERELLKYNIAYKKPKIYKTKIYTPKASTSKNSKYSIKSVEDNKNSITIVFDKNIDKSYVDYYENKSKNSIQDIYDLKGNFKDAYPTKLKINGVDKITIKQIAKNKLRIIFEDKKNLKTVYHISKNILRITVLNLNNKKNNISKTKISKSSKIYLPGRGRTVVLDAGHGGKDSGAIGRGKKKYEKYTVFEITKYLESYLKKRGYKVYLTRNSDRFIKVKDRTVLANKKHADIFISIHANAAHKTKINKMQGIETFFLSPARNERAKRVAELENKSDVRNMSGSTKQAFLESLNRPRITASHKLSIDIQKNMLFNARKIYKNVVDSGVREGPFWVLVGAQMPSVLVEVGYITHPIEGKRLFNSNYQKALALGIANGIDSYFAKNP